MSIKMQIVRKGTKYESYRLTIPKAIIEAHKLQKAEFDLKMEKNKLVFIPKRKKRK